MQSDYGGKRRNKTLTNTVVKDFPKTTAFCFAPGPKGDQGSKGDNGQDGKAGVKYIRWGRTSCPNGAELVYKG